tara:strand:- start:70 stop:351 length:282 start_codon:yes stop_codon:yes gene_type:complete
MRTMTEKRKVEFRLVSDEQLPPIVITMDDNDEPKVIINTYHRIWIGLNRKVIAGIVENLQEKMDMLLNAYLLEQRNFEKEDRILQYDFEEGSE